MLKMRSQLNQLSTLIDTKQWSSAQALRIQIEPQIGNLPPSRTAIYTQLNLAENLMRLKQANIPNAPTTENIAQLIAKNLQQAKSLGDKKAETYALGKLGGLYEQTQQWSIAQDLTQQALVLAQAINAPENSYRWQWQLGRILKAQGNEEQAIAAYTQAVKTLQSLRGDLVGIDADIQFSFRESVEPVYRELVSLLLQPSTSKASQKYLTQARQVIESLQLAELDDFFKEACLDKKPTQIDRLDPFAAVIYPIILADRLEVIVSLPQQPLRQYATSLPQEKLESIIEELRQKLVIRSRNNFLPLSQQIYDWLIRPIESDLIKSGIETLVFVLDGDLRNIPMAVLHDGNQNYLLEKYNIALTPGLELLPPKKLEEQKFKILGAGLTESRDGFSPLEYVEEEMKQIKSEMPSKILLNRTFTSQNLQTYLQSDLFPIVHIATHGQFSSKAEETFILAWDDRININSLGNLLETSETGQGVELLVLSACETAVGDKAATLGLAGMAVKTGASSTLATLWSVNDEGTANFIHEFYKHLRNANATKAEALRQAQIALLKNPQYKHPIYWAPYILVGNWL